ncbi:uncharacterized protein LOC124272597 [Haliotis rubra]|uniref:uncharacterized protein LOC124260800 n=1 Tax=Haliotis rubra TaxID=36100 RepID=UPI001EE5113E|nr:uncharacterized protein LOC124260800 [Haliotis rubra]XP_046563753.1 uncharacterized protein LOC124272597 [Haliotis rubra]
MVVMAHAVCHRMESIPRSCPPGRGDRDYEPVSEYKPQTYSKELHTMFACNEDFLADFIPLVSAPIPSVKPAALFRSQTDPTLCITPDKSCQGVTSGKQNLPSEGTTFYQALPSPDPRLSLTPQSITTTSRLRHGAKQLDTGVVPAVPTVLVPDPLLTVTPEHKLSGSSKAKSSLRTERNDPEAKYKLKYKVRFDLNAADSNANDKSFGQDVVTDNETSFGKTISKVYKPDLYFEEDKPDEDFHEPLSQQRTSQYMTCPSSDTTRTHRAVNMNSDVNAGKDPKLKNESEGIRKPDKSAFEGCERPDFIISSSNKGPSKRKVVVTRELQEHPIVTEYQYPFDAEDRESDVEHVFSRPEYNNSLKVYNEMRKVDGMVPDVASAVQEHLNEEKWTEISEKASSKVNLCFKSSQFNGLVGLQASAEDLQRKTEREITLKGKTVMHQSRKPSNQHEPDLLEFLCHDLQKEAPDLKLLGMTSPSEHLSTAPPLLAFDLYRHNRAWEGSL